MPTAKRRPRGTGSIYKDAAGYWHATQALPPDPRTGKRRRLSAKGKSRADAVARLKTKIKAAMMDGSLPVRDMPTLADYLTHWVESRAYRLRPTTQTIYRSASRRISGIIGETRLDHITPALLEKWQVLAEQQYAHRTVLTDRTLLSQALEQAVTNGLLTRNPMRGVDAPIGVSKRREAPTPAEASRIIALEENPVWRLQWCLAFLGMRQGERRGVTRGELVYRDGVPGILIQHQACRVEKGKTWPEYTSVTPIPRQPGWVYAPAKTQAGERWVPLLGTAWEAWQAVDRLNPGERDDLLCLSLHGCPLAQATERRAWARALKRAGVDRPLVPHSARHTADSILAMMGVPDATRLGIIGHTTTAMDTVYVHAQTDAMIDAARTLAERLESPTPLGAGA